MDIYETTREVIAEIDREFGYQAERVVLYGSVASHTAREDSDIDVAVILDDTLKCLPLDLEGLPHGVMTRAERIRTAHKAFPVHTTFYWQSEYDEGIELFSGRRDPPDLLHKVGKVVIDRSFNN